jgi:hypothetical protein
MNSNYRMSNPNNDWKNYGGRPLTPPPQLPEILLPEIKSKDRKDQQHHFLS